MSEIIGSYLQTNQSWSSFEPAQVSEVSPEDKQAFEMALEGVQTQEQTHMPTITDGVSRGVAAIKKHYDGKLATMDGLVSIPDRGPQDVVWFKLHESKLSFRTEIIARACVTMNRNVEEFVKS